MRAVQADAIPTTSLSEPPAMRGPAGWAAGQEPAWEPRVQAARHRSASMPAVAPLQGGARNAAPIQEAALSLSSVQPGDNTAMRAILQRLRDVLDPDWLVGRPEGFDADLRPVLATLPREVLEAVARTIALHMTSAHPMDDVLLTAMALCVDGVLHPPPAVVPPAPSRPRTPSLRESERIPGAFPGVRELPGDEALRAGLRDLLGELSLVAQGHADSSQVSAFLPLHPVLYADDAVLWRIVDPVVQQAENPTEARRGLERASTFYRFRIVDVLRRALDAEIERRSRQRQPQVARFVRAFELAVTGPDAQEDARRVLGELDADSGDDVAMHLRRQLQIHTEADAQRLGTLDTALKVLTPKSGPPSPILEAVQRVLWEADPDGLPS